MYNQKYHRFDTLYNHKFGFHINGPRQDAFEAVFKLRPRIVKTLDFSADIMKKIRREIPDVFLIGRLAVHPQDFGQFQGQHETMADRIRRAREKGRDMAGRILGQEVNKDIHAVNGRPVFDAWESLNEIFPESVDVDSQKLYDEYQVAFGEKIIAAGFEPIGMNFATGNFSGRQFIDNFPGTLETYKYLGFHEYDWPAMDRLHKIGLGEPDTPKNIKDRVPIAGEGRGNDGMWLCLRYRRILFGGVRQKYGDKHIAVITECGMTQGVQQGKDIGPWARENTLPRDYPDAAAPVPISVADYWKTLRWYNSELMKDDYVLGACLFVTGAAGLPEWETFEHLGPIMERLEAFQQKISPAQPAPTTPTETAVTVTKPKPAVEKPAVAEQPAPVAPAKTPAKPKPEPPAGQWVFSVSRGAGLPLLVGDIGLAGERITITKPYGSREQLISGSKPEYGPGGFETYVGGHGICRIQFLGQSFGIPVIGQFTRIIFRRVVGPGSVTAKISFRENRSVYGVNEQVMVNIAVENLTAEPVPFGILGLLTSTGHFQTSWDNGLIPPGQTFRHEDGLAFAAPGKYAIQLSICFSPRGNCLGPEGDWERFEPGLAVTIA